jgi:hypothetical protein
MPTGKRRFLVENLDCTAVKDEKELVAEIRNLSAEAELGEHIVKLILEGTPSMVINTCSIHEKIREIFFQVTLMDATNGVPLMPEGLEKKTILSDFSGKMLDQIRKEKPGSYKNSLRKSFSAAINAIAPCKENRI